MGIFMQTIKINILATLFIRVQQCLFSIILSHLYLLGINAVSKTTEHMWDINNIMRQNNF